MRLRRETGDFKVKAGATVNKGLNETDLIGEVVLDSTNKTSQVITSVAYDSTNKVYNLTLGSNASASLSYDPETGAVASLGD